MLGTEIVVYMTQLSALEAVKYTIRHQIHCSYPEKIFGNNFEILNGHHEICVFSHVTFASAKSQGIFPGYDLQF